jgi:hypothetical protein
VQILLTPRLLVPLAVAVSLLLALLVCEPGTGLHLVLAVVVPLLVYQPGTGLCVLLAVAVPLLLPLLVYQPGTGLCVLLAVAVPLLLPLLVCQPGTSLCVLLAVAVPLLLPGCGGHAVQIVPHIMPLVVKVCQIVPFLPLCQTPHTNWLPLRDQNLLECKRLVLEILYECFGQ